jgi:hypothetical protein
VKWHTTFGQVGIEEKCFIKEGKLLRPFSANAAVKCRECSLPLQRVITDFGADVSFAETINKIKEHYGIEVSSFAVQKVTKKHAKQIAKFKAKVSSKKQKTIVCEIDGGMVPIVEMQENSTDKRKTRKTSWKEVKLSCARGKDEIKRFYAGLIGSADEAGKKMVECAHLAGMQEGTYVHGVGDGAPWIVEQFKLQFCNRGNYFIDFFHLCEYLAKAAIWCNIFDKDKWLEESKIKLKTGKQEEVFKEIENKVKALQVTDPDSGLIRCYRYMEKRLEHLNYQVALNKQLPIGSGEIESSHRSVVQKRLKIAGAWWKEENANAMLQLRINRFNGHWEDYWQSERLAA